MVVFLLLVIIGILLLGSEIVLGLGLLAGALIAALLVLAWLGITFDMLMQLAGAAFLLWIAGRAIIASRPRWQPVYDRLSALVRCIPRRAWRLIGIVVVVAIIGAVILTSDDPLETFALLVVVPAAVIGPPIAILHIKDRIAQKRSGNRTRGTGA